jgi:hypothetical protein
MAREPSTQLHRVERKLCRFKTPRSPPASQVYVTTIITITATSPLLPTQTRRHKILLLLTIEKNYVDIDRIRTCAGEPKRFLISLLNHSDTMPQNVCMQLLNINYTEMVHIYCNVKYCFAKKRRIEAVLWILGYICELMLRGNM